MFPLLTAVASVTLSLFRLEWVHLLNRSAHMGHQEPQLANASRITGRKEWGGVSVNLEGRCNMVPLHEGEKSNVVPVTLVAGPVHDQQSEPERILNFETGTHRA